MRVFRTSCAVEKIKNTERNCRHTARASGRNSLMYHSELTVLGEMDMTIK